MLRTSRRNREVNLKWNYWSQYIHLQYFPFGFFLIFFRADEPDQTAGAEEQYELYDVYVDDTVEEREEQGGATAQQDEGAAQTVGGNEERKEDAVSAAQEDNGTAQAEGRNEEQTEDFGTAPEQDDVEEYENFEYLENLFEDTDQLNDQNGQNEDEKPSLVKEESFDMQEIHVSLNDTNSSDCIITSVYRIELADSMDAYQN